MPPTLAEEPDAPQGPQPIPFRPRPPHVTQLTDTLRLERAAEHLNATVCSQFDEPIVLLADQPQPSAALWRDLVELVRIDLGLSLSSRPVPEAHLNHALDARIEALIELVLSSRYTIAEVRPMLRADVRALLAEVVAFNGAIVLDTAVRR